jgi:hypothetical protein
MALQSKEATERVNRCLDALDTILTIGRGTIYHFKQQNKLLNKAKKEFEEAIGGLFSPDDVTLDVPPTSTGEPE